MKFTDDEITTIRTAARLAWAKLSGEIAAELIKNHLYIMPDTQEVIEAVAGSDDVEITLKSLGHVNLAERFAELEAEDVIELLTPEFQLH